MIHQKQDKTGQKRLLDGEDSIGFSHLKLGRTPLLMGTRARSIVTKTVPDKRQYKLHRTSQGTVPPCFSPPKLCVLPIDTNKLPKKPE